MALEDPIVTDGIQQVAHPGVKTVAVVSLAAGSWTLKDFADLFSVVASVLACLVSLHVLADWWWKKYCKSFVIRKGWYRAKDNKWFPKKKLEDDD